MALASQSVSPVSRRHNYRRRKRRTGRLVVLLGAVALAGLWFFWPGDDAEQVAPDEAGVATTDQPATGGDTAIDRGSVPSGTLAVAPTTTDPTPAPADTMNREPARTGDPLAGLTTTPVSEVAGSDPANPGAPSGAPAYQAPIPESLKTPNTNATGARLAGAIEMIESDPLRARSVLSELIWSGDLRAGDRADAREALNDLGLQLFYRSLRSPEDPFTKPYVIQSGDSLERIARRSDVNVEWGMLQMMNEIRNPRLIRADQRIKVPSGTFHAIVTKSEYVMDLYLENDSGRVIIASFPVGLGELDGTPTGRFKVRSRSKLVNPPWTNPGTGEYFYPDDPMNPIGERWIGLEGIDPANESLTGYGIHGTIDLDSIGADRSMGCIRLRDEDVIKAYDALVTNGSTITINP